MSLFTRLMTPTNAPPLTKSRVRTSYAVAIGTDILQFALGPLGWAGADQALDLVAAAVEYSLLGFHPLLLPTFMLELLPITDLLPTWTGCVALVVAARKVREDDPPPPGPGQVIDV